MGTPSNMGWLKSLGILVFFFRLQALATDLDPRVIGTWPLHPYSVVRGAAVNGPAVYLARGESGSEIVDFSNATMPLAADDFETDGAASDVLVSGDYAFVADESAGLVVLDVRNPLKPKRIAAAAVPGRAQALDKSGDLIFVAALHGGLQLVDIHDLQNPAHVGGVIWASDALRVASSGGFAYVVSADALRVVDARDASAPKVVRILPGNFQDVAVAGTNLCVTGATNMLFYNIATPSNPTLLATQKTITRGASSIRASTEHFVVSDPSGVFVFEVGKTNPPLAKVTMYAGYNTALAIAGDRIYVANGSDLSAIDLNNISSPVLSWLYHRIDFVAAATLAGTNAFVIDGTFHTMDVLDITNPGRPKALSRWPLPANLGSWNGLVARGTLAYVALERLFVIVDFSDPKNLRQVGSIEIAHDSHSVTLHDQFAYVYSTEAGLQIIDIADPGQPKMVSVTPIEGAQGHAAFSGDTAVIANGERGLTLLDVSNPASPRIRLATQDFGVCVGVEMRSDTLACVANAFALILVDLSDLDHPREIARYAEPNGIAAIQLLDDTVYIGAYSQIYGAQNMVDISDPRQPRVVGSAPIRPLLIGRSGQYACSFYDGLSIVDLKAPAHPQSMSHTAVPEAQKIALHGRDALLSASGGGLKVFDIANASQPIPKGELSAVQPNLFVRRNYAYAVGNSFQIVDLADPSNPRILSTLPEPGQCVVAFGKYAYIVSSKTFLTVISVTNALSPVVVRRVPVFGTALAAANGFLYSTRLKGLTVFDLSDPTAPRNVAAFTRLGDIFQNDIAISGSLLCMVGNGGFQIFDIPNPQRVWLLAQLDYVTGQRVAIAGNHAYVLNSQGGLQSVDISSPGHPKVVGGNATLRATGLAVSEDTVYIVGPQGLTILDHFYQPSDRQSLVMLSPIDPTSARVRVRGPSGQTARIQRSNTFFDWTDWQTISLGDASQDVLDREIASAKYYRTVSP